MSLPASRAQFRCTLGASVVAHVATKAAALVRVVLIGSLTYYAPFIVTRPASWLEGFVVPVMFGGGNGSQILKPIVGRDSVNVMDVEPILGRPVGVLPYLSVFRDFAVAVFGPDADVAIDNAAAVFPVVMVLPTLCAQTLARAVARDGALYVGQELGKLFTARRTLNINHRGHGIHFNSFSWGFI